MKDRRFLRMTLFGLAAALVAFAIIRSRAFEREPGPPVPWAEPFVERDLPEVMSDTLRVLVMRDPLSWEKRPKAVSGLEWELLERMADRLDVPVIAVEVRHPDSLWMALQQGRGDIIAAQLTPRKDHRRWVRFTRPYRHVAPVMAIMRRDPFPAKGRPTSTVRPAMDSLMLGSASPYRDRQYRFKEEVCVAKHPASDSTHTADDLLRDLVLGRVSAVVVTEAHAAFEAVRLPLVEFSGPIGSSQPLSFAVRKNAPALLKALNDGLDTDERNGALEQLFKGYKAAKKPTTGPIRSKRAIPVNGDSISPYDNAFRSYAGELTWDWHLLVAMAYKESRFDSTAVSTKGAHGIMQLMPRTAERLGVDSSHAVEAHIGAAVRFVNKLDTLWRRAVPDPEQRLRFVLASYNAGPGHVIDAQRLAEQLGLDPQRWEHHVERAVLLLARPHYYMRPGIRNGYCNGAQVFHYVRDVVSLYRELERDVPKADARPVKP